MKDMIVFRFFQTLSSSNRARLIIACCFLTFYSIVLSKILHFCHIKFLVRKKVEINWFASMHFNGGPNIFSIFFLNLNLFFCNCLEPVE